MATVSLTEAAQWATIASPIASFLVGLLTLCVLLSQIRLSRRIDESNRHHTFRLKQADVLQSLNLRYERIWDLRRRPMKGDDALMFFMHYWSLQLDQFDAWKSDFVPDQSIRTWMLQRHADFASNWEFNGMSFSAGWSNCSVKIVAPQDFRQIIEAMRQPGASVDDELRKLKPGFNGAS